MDILLGQDDIVGLWVSSHIGTAWVNGSGRTFGWVDKEGRLVAGVVLRNYDGINVWIDVAAEPKSRWLDRRGLWAVFNYCFNQIGVVRVNSSIAEDNEKSLKLNLGLGFKEEARLKRAAPGGKDMVITRMFREDCRWLGRAE